VKHAPLSERPVVVHGEGVPDRVFGVGVGHVEGLPVGRKADPVGSPNLLRQHREDAALRQPIHALEGQILARVVESLRKSEGRVGEVDVSVGADGQVVGAVEALSLEPIGEHGHRAVPFPTDDAAVAVLAEDQAPEGVEGEAVRAGLAPGESGGARVAARLQVHRERLARSPQVDRVGRNVREEEAASARVPDRTLGPLDPLHDQLERGVGGKQRVEAGVLPDHPPDRRPRSSDRNGGGRDRDGEEQPNGRNSQGLTPGIPSRILYSPDRAHR
jgi:hypothetical protein